MKILSDNNEIVQGRGTSLLKTNSIVKNNTLKHSNKSAANFNISASIRPGGNVQKRNITDALSMSLAARRLVQRAIEISSRLQGMAQKAMITGKADFDEVAIAVSRVNNVVQGLASTNAVSVVSSTPDIVPIRPSGNGLENNEYLADTETKLRKAESTISDNISSLGAKLEPLIPGSKVKSLSGEEANTMNRETALQIGNDPGSALKSQGNIDPGFVARIN